MTLAWIPRGILDRLQKICCHFLWKGKQTGRIFAWTKWESLALPKHQGGWGIKRLDTFSKALASKLGWQLLNNCSLWTKIVTSKYINPINPLNWIRQGHISNGNISIIWKAVTKAMDLIRNRLAWRIRSGSLVHIGEDPWVGCGNAYRLLAKLGLHLAEQGITHICLIADNG